MGVWNIASKHWKGRHPLSANSGCLEGALEESGGVNLDIAICKLPLPVSFPLIPTASWTLRISFIELGLQVGNEVFMKFDISSSVAELRSPCRSVLVQPPHHPPWGISPTPFPSGCLHVWTWAWSCCGVLLPCPLSVTTLILPFSVMASLVSLLFPPHLNDGRPAGQFFDTELWQPSSWLEVLASSCILFGSTSKLKKVTDDEMNLFSMQIT